MLCVISYKVWIFDWAPLESNVLNYWSILSIRLTMHIAIDLTIFLCITLSIYLFVCLSIYLGIWLGATIDLPIYLYIHPSTFLPIFIIISIYESIYFFTVRIKLCLVNYKFWSYPRKYPKYFVIQKIFCFILKYNPSRSITFSLRFPTHQFPSPPTLDPKYIHWEMCEIQNHKLYLILLDHLSLTHWAFV